MLYACVPPPVLAECRMKIQKDRRNSHEFSSFNVEIENVSRPNGSNTERRKKHISFVHNKWSVRKRKKPTTSRARRIQLYWKYYTVGDFSFCSSNLILERLVRAKWGNLISKLLHFIACFYRIFSLLFPFHLFFISPHRNKDSTTTAKFLHKRTHTRPFNGTRP